MSHSSTASRRTSARFLSCRMSIVVALALIARVTCDQSAGAAPPAPPVPRIDSIVLAPTQPFDKDPAVIWYDNFDGPDSVQARYLEPKVGSRDDRRTDREALGGAGKSLECFYAKGQQGVGNRKLVFGDSPVGRPLRRGETFDEVYWRVYVKHQPGWTGSPAKMSRATGLTSERWTQAFILHVWSAGAFLTLDPASGVRGGEVVTTRYNDFPHLRWLGNKPTGKFPIHSTDESGRWVCVEAHVKLNAPGRKDGSAELWVDGVLDTRRTGMDFRGTYAAHQINAVFLEAYWNEGSPADQSRWYDDFVVSTRPIGPLVASPNPTVIKAPLASPSSPADEDAPRAWEVEIATAARGEGPDERQGEAREIVWRSKPAPLTGSAARLSVSGRTGEFTGDAAGRSALGPLPGGAFYFCRCRQQGKGGEWSEWSPWHQPFVVAADAP